MNLDEFDTQPASEAGVWVSLKHPDTGAVLPARLRLRGHDAPSYQALRIEQRRRRLEQLARSNVDRVELEQLDEETVEQLVCLTVDWEGLTRNGEAFSYSAANARTLYTHKGWAWIREQAVAAIGNRANFLPPPASG
ncbi:MAG: hypothetical protein EPO27_10615 [Betaproteobacteria bacterium]|nr:MAG: hypothetical protein EPO27_10615 [Betaproteobacteria bacterium]